MIVDKATARFVAKVNWNKIIVIIAVVERLQHLSSLSESQKIPEYQVKIGY